MALRLTLFRFQWDQLFILGFKYSNYNHLIVAITNAINLIDGLDGLASGVSIIALLTIAFIAILQGISL